MTDDLTLDALIARLTELRQTLPGDTLIAMSRNDYEYRDDDDNECFVEFHSDLINNVEPVTDTLTYVCLFPSAYDIDDIIWKAKRGSK